MSGNRAKYVIAGCITTAAVGLASVVSLVFTDYPSTNLELHNLKTELKTQEQNISGMERSIAKYWTSLPVARSFPGERLELAKAYLSNPSAFGQSAADSELASKVTALYTAETQKASLSQRIKTLHDKNTAYDLRFLLGMMALVGGALATVAAIESKQGKIPALQQSPSMNYV